MEISTTTAADRGDDPPLPHPAPVRLRCCPIARATRGRDLDLPIYAIETSLGAGRMLAGARALARRSGIPRRRLVLVDRHATYDHVDPLSAVPPRNAFVRTVVPFLRAE